MPFGHVTFYLTLGLYGVALYNCVKVVGNRTSSGAAIAWILINLTFPYVGVPLYFLLGDFRIKGYVKRHKASTRELEDEGGTITLPPPPDLRQLPDAIRATYESFRTVFHTFGAVFEPQLGTVGLLVDGRDTFEAIFAAIAGARRFIIVQYYIVRSDRMGLELKRLLIEKAQSGIPVYMLYDDMGSFWLSRDYLRDLRRSGVRVERFLPIASFKRFFQMNFRNHRKLVAVDGAVAFTGGLNVGEEYAARRSKKAKTRYWRDTHVRITGAAVAQLEDIFFEDWYFATGEKVELGDMSHLSGPDSSLNATDTAVQVIPTGPTDEALISILLIMHLCNTAKRRLWIATPYFVPDPALLRAMELAALRGVDVRLMLPRRSDNRLVQWVSLSYGEQLQARGIKVMLYVRGFMHQKAILVDDHLAAVGTMNLDNRALYLNFETMVVIHGQEFNAKMTSMLEKDFVNCRYPRVETQPALRVLKKLRANTARLFAPLL